MLNEYGPEQNVFWIPDDWDWAWFPMVDPWERGLEPDG